MVKRITLYEFVSKNGYELIEKLGKSETSKILKLSRPTIDTILREHPTPPKRTIPKYVFQWEETAGNQAFMEKCHGKLRHYKFYVTRGMKAWLLLDKKDPMSWDIEDFRRIWDAEQFRDPESQKISFGNACIFRKWMRAIGRAEFCDLEEFETKDLKKPKGERRQWFLEDAEILRMIEGIDRCDLLVGFVIGLLSGGRASSIMETDVSKGIRPIDIDEENYGILMFEPKRKEYVLRLFHPKVIELVKRYVMTYGIKPNEPLFLGYSTMQHYLKKVARKMKVSKIADVRGAWHITKHTFVTQGAYHGLSMDVIKEQAGTDATTLFEWYAGMKEKKMRAELLGEKVEIEPFHLWSLRVIIEPAIKRYQEVTSERLVNFH